MTSEKLLDLLGEMDDRFVDEAVPEKKKSGKKRLGFLTAAACIALTVAIAIPTTMLLRAGAREDAITAELERLGAGECTYVGEETMPDGKTTCRHYLDEETQTDYYFDTNSGLLNSVTCFSIVDAPAKADPLSDEERDAAVLAYVQHCIAPYQIGELKITSSYFNGRRTYSYTLTEYYQGQETGTVIYLSATDNAEIIFCTFKRGEIFDSEPAPTIGKAAAIEAAQTYAGELAAERGYVLTGDMTCTLKAFGASRYYLVEIGVISSDEYMYQRIIRIRVDASSGTLIGEEWTQ
ncbi:MAG: hypothetical protein CW335_04480 [Clostridiales bacterium]|nr:hypothetical protein [Clostridiales bacterium]